MSDKSSLEPRMNADKRRFQALTQKVIKVRGNGFLLSASIRVNPRFFPPPGTLRFDSKVVRRRFDQALCLDIPVIQ